METTDASVNVFDNTIKDFISNSFISMKLLDRLAKNLCRKVKVVVGEVGCSLVDIYKCQRYG